MTFSDQGKPAPIGHNSQHEGIEKIVQALERDGFEAQKPKAAIPYEELQKLARRALKSEEARDDLADAVQGDLYSALSGAIDVPTGADLAGAPWLREATGPTALLALARYARMGGDVTGAFLLYVIVRCVREALTGGGGAEFRASDGEIAGELGVSTDQVRRARLRLQPDGGVPFLTIEAAERSKPRYALGSIPAIAVAGDTHLTSVIDRLATEGLLRSTDRQTKPRGASIGDRQSAAHRAADFEREAVENAKSAAHRAANAAAYRAANGNAPTTKKGNPRRGARQMEQSAARCAADAGSLKRDEKSRARPASCSNISRKEPVSTEDALDRAAPHTIDRASEKEEHASRGTAIAVRDQHEEISDHQAAIARQGAPDRAQKGGTTYPSNDTPRATLALPEPVALRGEIIEPEDETNPASLIGVVERKREFVWVCPKSRRPQKLSFHFIENTLGASITDKASVRAWAKEEIATAIEQGKDGNLVALLRHTFGTSYPKFVKRRAAAFDAMNAAGLGPTPEPLGHLDVEWFNLADDTPKPKRPPEWNDLTAQREYALNFVTDEFVAEIIAGTEYGTEWELRELRDYARDFTRAKLAKLRDEYLTRLSGAEAGRDEDLQWLRRKRDPMSWWLGGWKVDHIHELRVRVEKRRPDAERRDAQRVPTTGFAPLGSLGNDYGEPPDEV